MGTVSNNWLVKVNVNLNLATAVAPNFQQCLLIGIMPTQTSPYQCPPSSWGGNIYQNYTSLTTFVTDMTALLDAALFAGDQLQANRFQWLLNAGEAFFAQSPTPQSVYVAAAPLTSSATNWTTNFANIVAQQNAWYGATICDLIFANTYSMCLVSVTTTGSANLVAGTTATPNPGISTIYYLPQQYSISGPGTYTIPFYSIDGSTTVASSHFTGISPSPSVVSAVTNSAAAVNGIPGFLTATTGVIAGINSLRSNSNQKKFFQDTLDYTVQENIQNASGGTKDLLINFHSLNLQSYNATSSASISAAALSEYFTDIFTTGVGLKPYSSMQLAGQIADPYVTTANIGTPGNVGSSTNLIGFGQNVFPSFGGGSGGINLLQYGYMSNSTFGGLTIEPFYLDQVVGADYIQFTTQAALVTFIISQQPTGGVLYNDFGIQQIVTTFKNALQSAVNQNIIQPITNAQVTYLTYAQCSQTNITNKLYTGLVYNGEFLSRIQTLSVNVNLSL